MVHCLDPHRRPLECSMENASGEMIAEMVRSAIKAPRSTPPRLTFAWNDEPPFASLVLE